MPHGPEREPWSAESQELVETVTAGLDTIDHVPATQWFEKELESLAVRSYGAIRKLAADVLAGALEADDGLDQRIEDAAISFGPEVAGFHPRMLDQIVTGARLWLERWVERYRVSEASKFALRPDRAYAEWVAQIARRATVDVANHEREPVWRGARLGDEQAFESLYEREVPVLFARLRTRAGASFTDAELDDICHRALLSVIESASPVFNPPGYLWRAAYNRFVDVVRQHKRDAKVREQLNQTEAASVRVKRAGSAMATPIMGASDDTTGEEGLHGQVRSVVWRGIKATLGRDEPAPRWWSPDLRARRASTGRDREDRDRHARNVRSAAVAALDLLSYEFDPLAEDQPETLAREAVREQFSPMPNDQGVQRSYQDVVYAVWRVLVGAQEDLARTASGPAQLVIRWRIAQLRPVTKLLKSGLPATKRDGSGYVSGDAPDRMEARARWIRATVDDLMGLPHDWTPVVLSAVEAPLEDLEAAGRTRASVVERANAAYDDERADDEVHRKASAVIEAYSTLHSVAELLGGR